ncbi:MAG: Ldh family oxidoreductase [Thermomicrobiales bacterium]|nr:Ldh family oxidoreductase [Thermomicrobiales bacterium]
MTRRTPDQLRVLMTQMLQASGTPSDLAAFVGASLVDANLTGHDSHGVIRILAYLAQVRSGALDPVARAEVVNESGATILIDGRWGWGQPAMHLATTEAIRLAREFGLGLATVERCYHIGRVAPYVEQVAAAKMVGIAMANAGAAVAPFGARSRVMGTNPFAWSVPRADGHEPVTLDVATAFIAEGKLRVARAKGLPAPPGAVVNADGLPSDDPNDFYNGGALMAFGAHKGSGMSLFAQLMGRGLAGQTPEQLAGHGGGNGPVIIAIDPERLRPLTDFLGAVEDQVDAVHAAMPAEGISEVLLPGEPEIAERARRERDGIEVADPIWESLVAEAAVWGVVVG